MLALVLFAQETGSPALDSGYDAMTFVFWAFGIAVAAFTIWLAVDAFRKEPTPGLRIGWALLILCLPLAGAMLYFCRKATYIRPTS